MGSKVRHVLGLSGGKDSSALAIYMRDRVPEMEYYFCDTQKELPETYEYLDRLQAYLGKPIIRLNAERGFDHWLEMYGGYLPSSQMRWCTRMLKIKPFEEFVGDDPVISYIGIRADEDREGYISHKPNITPIYPFKEDGIRESDVFEILQNAGVGLPKYYEWRTRSGCYFCFFQRKAEWVGLMERHPELYEKAKQYEKFDEDRGVRYTWSNNESLAELADPVRIADIKRKQEQAVSKKKKAQPGQKLYQIFNATLDDEDDTEPCTICTT
ncbi:MAG TPA: phosphoadenosine phosphosulfate reductase family protein [Pyrinomonadaceae bacterium]|jgi:3'-phosphoadenosine 5'-phosphosulfate sulfotransferase (PAPS reductase)/FAD synthetase|nr:phosphoadenosine phosphosulfate reductase family protein [Pyrinomonadaceae bacterium]